MGKRIFASAAALAVAGLLLSACAPAADDSPSGVQAESFPAVYAQTIDWGECDADYGLHDTGRERLREEGVAHETFECAMITAPIDWNDPKNHGTIELAVVHIPATGGEKIGTLFGNPGGPGASGIDYTFGMTVSSAFQQVMEQYDLIGFDPRGIGRSTPIECEQMSNVRELQLALCAAEQPLAHSMGTSQVARDMDLLRTLQGEPKLDYLGYSYGTILGATYSTLFPERVGRMVLDSAPDDTWAAPTGNYTQSLAMVAEIDAMLANCGTLYEVEVCPLRSDDDLGAKMQQLAEQPLVASDGTEIDGWTLFSYLQTGLYGRDVGRPVVLDTVGAALAGDQQGIDAIAEALAGGGASVSFAGQIVGCHSLPQDPDILGLIETIEKMGAPELLGGPEISEEFVAQYADISCGALPESGDDLESFSAPEGTTVLVLGVTGDHATPYENGRHLAAQMGNTRFVTLEGHGHGASYTDRSTCIDDAVTQFLLAGELPEQRLVCQTD
ncbi:alpha/beta hydrolase [Leucobacter sp. gxy201]|uniref:alpha/beta hydrolase n=1 Tax=Leucobacter sp. gxy201 TaxID=2957200 RepID=UPI003DA0DE2D